MPTLRTVLFWLGFYLSTIVITSILTISFVFPFRIRYIISKGWPLFNLWWLKVTCGLKYTVQGMEHIPDESVIFMSKHQSTWETITYQLFMPPMVWVLKRELLWIPIFGWGVAMLNPIAINRKLGKQALKQLIDQGKKRLHAGISVMIFPEGTRTMAGEQTQYRPGGALLAAKSGHKVVPIAHNAGYYWPKGQFFKHPGTITVVIGEPIDSRNKSAAEIMKEVETWIENKMLEIGGP
jgi:1-acyl-sn-glycerol-3-phosphate acyltransferase